MKNLRISKAYWLWFQFSNKDMKFLKKIKTKVNEQMPGPNFDIHLTFVGPYLKITKDDLKLFKKNIINLKKIRIYLSKYSYSKNKFTSLFISVKKSKKLVTLRKRFNNTNYLNSSSIYKPHISLFYGYANKSVKIKLISQLPKLQKFCIIDKLCLVDVDENINKWKIIKRIRLNK